ncbi:MAG: hypothetical protein HOJ35_03905 [Bdellovibrionales bacterium]|nr:hypothetical protein [Bdellovibrionales bacterium]
MRTSLIIIFIFSFIISKAFANKIQILHTNDIHSHLEHTTHQPEIGGYARLKSLIQEKKDWALENNIETIAMDAGDYLEGNMFYMADWGKKSYQVHGEAGFDVSVIGNHDYLMGERDLDALLRDVDTSFQLLGANLHVPERYENINEKIKPYIEMEVNGVKIGIIGITINDILYKWRLSESKISNEIKSARKYARILKNRGNDLVIALTHIGLKKDKKLAKKVPEIDLIVGGHSHDALHEVYYQKSKKGKMIPIVQAGKHAEWLGQLIIDYDPDSNQLKVDDYKLLKVENSNKNMDIEYLVEEANQDLNDLYGESWLNETVGQSELRPQHLGGNGDTWIHFINDSMRETANADIAIHVDALSGRNYPTTGNITRKDLYNSNPRTFEFENLFGYNVYTAKIKGLWVGLVFKVVMRFGLPLYISGITFDYKKKGDNKYKVSNLKVHGKRLKMFKRYNVGMSEAIIRGGIAITPWVKLLLNKPRNTLISMWEALEERLRTVPIVKENYASFENLEYYFYKKRPIQRMMIPGAQR